MPFDRDLRDLLRATKALARSPAENVQRRLEDPRAMLERYARAGELRVARQLVRLSRLQGKNVKLAEDLLITFEDDHLARSRAERENK
ncbi:MAG TPA: hypothetical protein VKZ79_19695 [Alphaproteobacteria bacterium]|nr:hypothetical protein [Alphaproteobacteria bacterium]